MSDQEPEMNKLSEVQENGEDGGLDTATINHLTMLRLTSPTEYHHHPTSTTEPPVPAQDHCSMCGNGSMKRQSPSSTSFQEPTSKKPTLQPPSSTTTDHNRLRGFTKLPLPVVAPVLRRCVSDPVNSPGTSNGRAPNTQIAGSSFASVQFSNPQSPENFNVSVPVASPSPAKPPLPQIYRRSVSDLTSSACQLTTTTPPRAPAARTFSSSPSSVEMGPHSIERDSPNAKRLKRMKDRMKEMSQWCDQVMREGEEEDSDHPQDNNIKTVQDNFGSETEEAIQEAVWVERSGEGLVIHFKCPCGEGYEILLSGDHCYYKLM